MQVMLLAAGKGTRLGALGQALPKPLVPVCGHPPLAFCLALCRAAGLDDVVVNVHHHADLIRQALGDGRSFGVSLRYSDETHALLGSGGGLVHARRLFRSEPVLAINGKVVADADLSAIIAAHEAAGPDVVATMVVRGDGDLTRFAPVEIDETGRVIGLRGQRGAVAPQGLIRPRMFTGIAVLTTRLLDRLPAAGESDVVTDAYLPALMAGERIASIDLEGYFEEHSTPERYLAGNLALLRRPSLLRHPPGPLAGIAAGARVHANSQLNEPVLIEEGVVVAAGARVGPGVVLGRGCQVSGGADLERTVVWRDVVVTGTVRDAIVTEGCIVPSRP